MVQNNIQVEQDTVPVRSGGKCVIEWILEFPIIVIYLGLEGEISSLVRQ